jgi:hypothetical protein
MLAMEQVALLAVLIFAAALLYSSVRHTGASGYLTAMALVGVAPEVMKPTALALNILVATITTVRYYRAGCFYWSKLHSNTGGDVSSQPTVRSSGCTATAEVR